MSENIHSSIPLLTESVRAVFEAEHISYAAAIPFSACRVICERKLSVFGLTPETVRTVLVFLVPYYAAETPFKADGQPCGRNISVYAAARDYHLYFSEFFARVCSKLGDTFPGYIFSGSADNAPIDERHAAVSAGLGMVGDSGLLINETYGTYVFIGEILSDMPRECFYDDAEHAEPFQAKNASCPHCGACRAHCPMQDNPFGIRRCLSEVTQTKQLESLTRTENGEEASSVEDYIDYIRYYGSAWGCDRCQSVCPFNREPRITPIPFFRERLTPYLTSEQIKAMPDDDFRERAYAWRKKATVVRNLELLERDLAAGLPAAELLEAIEEAVLQAGKVLSDIHGVESQKGAIDEKAGDANFVTVYDVRIQNMLMERLHAILPEAKFFAEEKENSPDIMKDGYCFVIDPIDGTTNFIHNYGISAISVGLLLRGRPVYGCICDPYRGELYTARLGLGAFCNGKRIHVSDRPSDKRVFAVGTAPYYRSALGDRTFAMMRRLFDAGADIRRLGSAALDLAAVACGRADGYAELLISPWDFAAGALLVTEAGGVVTDLNGRTPDFSRPTGILAASADTLPTLLDAVRGPS